MLLKLPGDLCVVVSAVATCDMSMGFWENIDLLESRWSLRHLPSRMLPSDEMLELYTAPGHL